MDIAIRNVTYRYPSQSHCALENVSATIGAGEFVLVIGASNSGKTTLLRALNGLVPGFYGGVFQGDVIANGQSLRSAGSRALSGFVGSVFQDPERQFVMHTVERELAFGLENRGVDPRFMERRIAEVLSFFDMSQWLYERISVLSGGQKQRLAIASALLAQPEVLVLDEPTSQLDPTAAEDVYHALERIRNEWGITVVMAEHRLDRALPVCSRVIHMNEGQIRFDGVPEAWLDEEISDELAPLLTKTFRTALGSSPVNVNEARHALERIVGTADNKMLRTLQDDQGSLSDGGPFQPFAAIALSASRSSERDEQRKRGLLRFRWLRWRRVKPLSHARSPQMVMDNVSFRYSDSQSEATSLRESFALRDVTLRVDVGEIVALLGPNGSGKTTLLKQMNGLLRPNAGAVWIAGENCRDVPTERLAKQVGYVPQNPYDYFLCDTVMEECLYSQNLVGLPPDQSVVQSILERFELWDERNANPRDLSGGQRIRAAIASVMASDPAMLLFDEPTRGIDSLWKKQLGVLFNTLAHAGKSIVFVTHDVEFAAEAAHRVVLLFSGQQVADGTPQEVFSAGLFYCPPIGRAFHAVAPHIVTSRDAITFLQFESDSTP